MHLISFLLQPSSNLQAFAQLWNIPVTFFTDQTPSKWAANRGPRESVPCSHACAHSLLPLKLGQFPPLGCSSSLCYPLFGKYPVDLEFLLSKLYVSARVRTWALIPLCVPSIAWQKGGLMKLVFNE